MYMQDLNKDKPPSKYSRQKPDTSTYVYLYGRGRGYYKTVKSQGQKFLRIRNCSVYDFSLRLTDHLVFGEATLALCFSLLPLPDYDKYLGQVLVVSLWGGREGVSGEG